MPEGLKIQVGADVQQAVAAMDKVADSLNIVSIGTKKTGLAFDNLSDKVKSFGGGVGRFLPPVIANFNKLPPAVDKAAKSLSRLSNTSSAATQTSINLGRVIQDAPFGFLGIANNLNPLLESYQRLRKENVSVGATFKQLGSSLLGAGGLGLALSVVSSGLILFGDKLFGASKAAKQASEDADRLKSVLKDLASTSRETIAGGEAGGIEKVRALSAAVLDQTKSYAERNRALLQLKEINKDYFGDLTLESKSLATLTGRVEEYTNAIISAAIVKAFSDDIGKLSVELSKQLTIFNKSANALDQYKRQLASTNKFYTSLTGEERAGSKEYVELTSKISKGTKAYKEQSGIVNDLTGKLTDLRTELQSAVSESLKFKPLTATPDAKKIKDLTDEIISKGKAFAEALKDVFIVPEFSIFDTKNEQFAKAKKLLDDFFSASLIVRPMLKIRFEDVEFPPLPQVVEDTRTDVQRFSDVLGKEYTEYFKKNPIDVSLVVAVQNADIDKQKGSAIAGLFGFTAPLPDIFSNVEKGAIRAATAVRDILTPAFSGLFDAILAGENPMKAFFKSLGQAVAQLIQKLISAAITAAILSAIFPGGVGAAKGFGAIFGKILGFASGGIVSGPTLALIGEGTGTSRSNPEVVAPLDQLRSMLGDMGGGRQQVYVTGRLRGNDMVLQNARTSRSQRRTTGR